MKAEAVIELVDSAFRPVQRPEFTLADAAVAEGWRDERCRFAEHDRRWEDLSDEDIERPCDPFFFLPVTSWSYYMPAYMIYSIRHAIPRGMRSMPDN